MELNFQPAYSENKIMIKENFNKENFQPAHSENKIMIKENFNKENFFKIKKIKIYGNNEILSLIDLKEGDKIDIKKYNFDKTINNLLKYGNFKDIKIHIHYLNNKEIILEISSNEIDYFNTIEVIGITEKESKLIFDKDFLKKDLNDDLIIFFLKRINEFYEKKGYTNIQYQMDYEENNKLKITVKKGNLFKIKDLIIEGNNFFSKEEIKNIMINSFKEQIFVKDKFKLDQENLINLFKINGFKEVKILSEKIKKINNNYYLLNLKIDQGNQYFLRNCSFKGNKFFNDNILKQKFNSIQNKIFNLLEIKSLVLNESNPNSLISEYKKNGYFNPKFSFSEKKVDDNVLDLEISILENEKFYFNKINLIGNKKVKDSILLQEITFSPGDLWSHKKIIKSLENLKKLDLFENVDWNNETNKTKNQVDINFLFTEKKNSEINFKMNYKVPDLFGQFFLKIKNFSLLNFLKFNKRPYGDNQKVNFLINLGENLKEINLSFIDPKLFNFSKFKLNLFSSKEKKKNNIESNSNPNLNEEKNYYLTKNKNSIKFIKKLKKMNKLEFHINYDSNKKSFFNKNNLITKVIKTSKNLKFKFLFNKNTIDKKQIFMKTGENFKLKSIFTLPSLLRISNFKKKFFEYFQFQLKTILYNQFFNNLMTKIGYEFGFILNNNSNNLNNFYMGGTNFEKDNLNKENFIPLRGYSEPNKFLGVITPKNGGVIYNKYKSELRYLILDKNWFKFWISNFFEAGNIFDNYKNFSLFNLKRSIGTGLRLFVNYIGYLGCDLSYRLDKTLDKTTKPGWKLNFIFDNKF
ncbi:outer membrane protein [Candidatus Karelsulcia muelleri PSPU]|uniref:Outer membrane protein n=1 Tax=Candidatus Karelsulcia muelleri PSPU TaxID=1189303 RepID=A0AAD1AYK7_9FLAO|nr:outer membrane protein [Candidatus Karelsulcia muelleri PSPU]